jgi:hypothetical protein
MSSAAETDRRALKGQATRDRLIEAAREVLVAHGHAGTSTRAVANEALLARQNALFSAPGPLSEKWRIACDFLDEDLHSGYVRVLWELWAAGLTDPELAAGWRDAVSGWRDLLEEVFAVWSEDVGLELPITPRMMATLVGNIFYGMEVDLLAGLEGPHREVLDAIGALIARAETGLDYDALARGWASK